MMLTTYVLGLSVKLLSMKEIWTRTETTALFTFSRNPESILLSDCLSRMPLFGVTSHANLNRKATPQMTKPSINKIININNSKAKAAHAQQCARLAKLFTKIKSARL